MDSFLPSDGELANLIRAFDWASTPLGAIDGWPQSLRTATNLLVASPTPIVLLWGPHGVMIYNDAYARFAGKRHPQLLGSNVLEGWPEVAEFNENIMKTGLAGGSLSYRDQELVLSRTGTPERVFLNLDYSPVYNESGRPGGVIAIVVETTRRVMAARHGRTLIRLTDRLRDLEEQAHIAFAAAETLGMALGAGRVAYGTIDVASDTLHIDRDWSVAGVESLPTITDLRDYDALMESLKRNELVAIADVREDERTISALARLEGRNVRSVVTVPIVEQGRLVAVFFVNDAAVRSWSREDLELIREVAERTRTAVERARTQAELRTSAEALRHLNETLEHRVQERTEERDRLWRLSEDMLAQADYKGRLLAVSPSWTRILGYSETELLNRPYTEIIHPDYLEKVASSLKAMLESGQPARFENRFLAANGDWKPIEWTVSPESDGIHFIAIGRDISGEKEAAEELERAQEALRQSQKMEAMGQLTGGVAHDFNNLLTPIVGALDMLQRQGVCGEREQRLIEGAMQSADRAKTLVQRLLAFARRQPLQASAVDITKLVAGMADLIASTSGPQIRVVADAAEGLPPAQADQNQLEMALLNLGVNARDAMPDGGVLSISADADDVGPGHKSGLPSGRYVRLTVADTGIGMDEAVLKRAIEPFFSTKGTGKGTGLGLSMVHGLAAQLGGALSVESRPGIGSNIELWLPVSETPIAEDQDEADEESASAARGTVLLVDDEALVRATTAEMLSELGYAVVEAESAEHAIRLIDDGLKPSLLVTDHLMPGMNGTELAQSLRTGLPDLPVLIVSGYAGIDGLGADLPRLAKPFRGAELAASLAALG